jgi:endonuclease YncB( thermonuclease family)
MKQPSITAFLLLALACSAATIEARVVGVADGDTITVLDVHGLALLRICAFNFPISNVPERGIV